MGDDLVKEPKAPPLPGGPEPKSASGEDIFQNVDPLLSEKDLTSPGARKFLLFSIRQQDKEIARLRRRELEAYLAERDLAVCGERLHAARGRTGMRALAGTVGGIGVGVAFTFWGTWPHFWLVMFVSLLVLAYSHQDIWKGENQ